MFSSVLLSFQLMWVFGHICVLGLLCVFGLCVFGLMCVFGLRRHLFCTAYAGFLPAPPGRRVSFRLAAGAAGAAAAALCAATEAGDTRGSYEALAAWFILLAAERAWEV